MKPIYIGATRLGTHVLISAADVESGTYPLDVRAVWRVDGVQSADRAIAAILLHAADQWLGGGISVIRLMPHEPHLGERLGAARDVLRRDYWSDVNGVAEHLRDEIGRGNIIDRESACELIDETVDGHERVIYTGQAIECLLLSPNDGAYFEELGSEGVVEDGAVQWSRLAYFALRADVMDELGDLDELLITDPCAECGRPLPPRGEDDTCEECQESEDEE